MREFVFNETMQVGIVVRDLDAAIRCDRNIRYGSNWDPLPNIGGEAQLE